MFLDEIFKKRKSNKKNCNLRRWSSQEEDFINLNKKENELKSDEYKSEELFLKLNPEDEKEDGGQPHR